ncbi:MAG: DUF167 family protein [Candidatus Methanofastidiosia archaeon]|jgi:uncharacterized protein (TIGR00251 family)
MECESAVITDGAHPLLCIRVIPNSSQYSIAYDKWRKELKIKVKAVPKKGKANKDVLNYLSQYFESPVIVSGATTHSKKVQVSNTVAEVLNILENLI